ncbi:winged helix DNA-binding protein [Sphingobium ummariense]
MIEDFSYAAPARSTLAVAGQDGAGLVVVANGTAPYALEAAIEAAGLRWLDTVAPMQVAARFDAPLAGDVLLFCTAATPDLAAQLVALDRLADQRAMPLIVVADLEDLDLAYACVHGQRAQLLCRPDRADLVAALVTAAEQARANRTVHDRDKDSDGARLQQLSEEVSRLARTIEALTRRSRAAPPSFDAGPRISDRSGDYAGMPALSPIGSGEARAEEPVHVSPGQVRDLLRARRMRADFLPGDLFADPAWDMMLDLLAARLEHERVSVSSLCIAAAVPPTTALRWIRTLTEQGLVERQNDPRDGRRVFISLTEEAAHGLTRWFGASRRYRCA